MAKKTKGNKVFWPNCSVCQYMKERRDFRAACLRSSYFDPKGQETLSQVHARYGSPFKPATLYRHMSRHQKQDIEHAERLAASMGQPSAVWQRKKPDVEILQNTVEVVEADVMARQKYEIGLDEFIDMGRDRLKHNEMTISAANYISAIKVKAEIERTTKDRRLEMLRSMFAGAAPQQKEGQ